MTNLALVSHIDHLTPKQPAKSATLKSRTYAFVVDLYSIVFLNKMISFTWLTFVNKFIGNIALADKSKSALLFNGISNFSLPIIFTCYFFFFYYLNNGKTLGKILFKLKVCAKNDRSRELTFTEALSRSVGYLFCNYLFYIPFALVYLRKDGKGIHDYISSTYVLRDDEIALLESLEEKPIDLQISLFPEDPVANRISKVI